MTPEPELLSEIRTFLAAFDTDQLPTTSAELDSALKKANELVQRFDTSKGGRIADEFLELTFIQSQLLELKKYSDRRDKAETERRRTFSRSESFTIASLERSVKSYRERLDKSTNIQARERLASCLVSAESQLRGILEGKISSRSAMQRTQELGKELVELRTRLARSKNPDVSERLILRIAEIEKALNVSE